MCVLKAVFAGRFSSFIIIQSACQMIHKPVNRRSFLRTHKHMHAMLYYFAPLNSASSNPDGLL